MLLVLRCTTELSLLATGQLASDGATARTRTLSSARRRVAHIHVLRCTTELALLAAGQLASGGATARTRTLTNTDLLLCQLTGGRI